MVDPDPIKKKSFTEVTLKQGNINLITGRPGTGKTNFVNFLIEHAIPRGFNCLTNINYFTNDIEIAEAISEGFLPPNVKYKAIPSKLHVIRKFSDMVLILLSSKRNVVFLDEAGIFASSTNVMSKNVRQIKELSYIIRHLRSSFVLVCQAKKSIAPDLRTTLMTYEMKITKPNESSFRIMSLYKTVPGVDDRDIGLKYIDSICGLPLTKLPWDGFFLPSFSFDIDLSETFRRLSEFNSVQVRKPENGPRIIREMVSDTDKPDEKTRRESREELNERARVRYQEMIDNNEYEKRSHALTGLARECKRSYPWALALCRDIPWD